MSDTQNRVLHSDKPNFKSPESVLTWSGETFLQLFEQTSREKAAGRARLLNNFIDSWSKIYLRYEAGESLQQLKKRLDVLECERGLRAVK